MMLDYDPHGEEVLGRDEIIKTIRKAVPGLVNASMLWWPSSSSYIFNGDKDLTGLRGQRVYILVKNAADIPRAGAAIVEYFWAAGLGYIEISKSGSLLERCPVDSTVWQTNRLDFAAGAICSAPLVQRRGDPEIVPGNVEVVDTQTTIPNPCDKTIESANHARAIAKAAAQSEAAGQRELWVETRVTALTQKSGDTSAEAQQRARVTAQRAVEDKTLAGDYVITVIEKSQRIEVTVGEILDNPARFHGALTLDPIEPDYLGGKDVGKLYLYRAVPILNSFAHGGRVYKLRRQPRDIEILQGNDYETTLATIEVLRQSPEFFDFGNAIATVSGVEIRTISLDSLIHQLGGITRFYAKHVTKDGSIVRRNFNPPLQVCKSIMALGAERGLKSLDAVITAPTLRLDGTVLSVCGYAWSG